MDSISYLLQQGEDVDARDHYRWTPLHYAAGYNNLQTVKLLVDSGANIKANDIQGNNALVFAAENSKYP